jgi:type I restriction-modification system DNA methylase subunit
MARIRANDNDTAANLGFEAKLWQAADALRNNMDAAEDHGEPFQEKMRRLTATLREQQAEAAKLDAVIAANLKELGYGV